MWVFCGGMFRSGSTVQYQIASHIVESSGRGRRVPFVADGGFEACRESLARDSRSELLIFKSHGVSEPIRAEVVSGGGRVITVHRDIRDVVVSAMRKNGWSFRKIWRHDRLRYWTERFDEWAALRGALVSRYDRLVSDLPAEVRSIASHLGVGVDVEESTAIAACYAIDRQRERTARVRSEQGDSRSAIKYDPHSLLHHNHIASGEIGSYRSVLRPAEIRAIEDECGAWMAKWGYEPDRPSLTVGQRLIRFGYRPHAAASPLE